MIVSKPFVAETRPPALAMPRGATDCHAHVFGDPARFPYRNANPRISVGATLHSLGRMHRVLGIERLLLVQPSAYVSDHAHLLNALKRLDSPAVRGVVILGDDTTDGEIEAFHEAGIRGARFNFWKDLGTAPSIESFRRSVDRIRGLGWHIKIYASPDDLIELGDEFRKVTVDAVIDHMAHLDFSAGIDHSYCRAALDLLRRDNWWMLLANGDRSSEGGLPWNDALRFGQAMYAVAPDRCIWASDWPHLAYSKTMPNDAELLELVCRYLPDEEAVRKVMVDNPARLLGFGDLTEPWWSNIEPDAFDQTEGAAR